MPAGSLSHAGECVKNNVGWCELTAFVIGETGALFMPGFTLNHLSNKEARYGEMCKMRSIVGARRGLLQFVRVAGGRGDASRNWSPPARAEVGPGNAGDCL
jgi:hypothetical protein